MVAPRRGYERLSRGIVAFFHQGARQGGFTYACHGRRCCKKRFCLLGRVVQEKGSFCSFAQLVECRPNRVGHPEGFDQLGGPAAAPINVPSSELAGSVIIDPGRCSERAMGVAFIARTDSSLKIDLIPGAKRVLKEWLQD